MLNYPEIDPVAIHISEHIKVHWYGLMYVIGFAGAWGLFKWRTRHSSQWNTSLQNDLFYYCALGVFLGGRIGYTVFYNLAHFIHDPLVIFRIWEGGMSFHGGLIGVLVALLWFGYKTQRSFLSVTDVLAPVVPVGLAAGRMGNFINGELFGKVTDVPWAMVFPMAGHLPRHPSQLYAVICEGLILWMVLWAYAAKPRPCGHVSGAFLLGYGVIRFGEEFFRQPDPQYGYLALGWLTMGQILCLPMMLIGLYLLFPFSKKKNLINSML